MVSFSSRTSGGKRRNFYEVLEVMPNAKMGEIKSKYYELSKKYHPDLNKDNPEASVKFREISEAYEVLGNYDLRRQYANYLKS